MEHTHKHSHMHITQNILKYFEILTFKIKKKALAYPFFFLSVSNTLSTLILSIEVRISCMMVKHSNTEPYSPKCFSFTFHLSQCLKKLGLGLGLGFPQTNCSWPWIWYLPASASRSIHLYHQINLYVFFNKLFPSMFSLSLTRPLIHLYGCWLQQR